MSDRIRNHVVLAEKPPTEFPTIDTDTYPSGVRPLADGDMWVDSSMFVIYAYDSTRITPPITNPDGTVTPGASGWIGVTDKSNTGSIVYFRDTAPTLLEIYPSLANLPDGVDGVLGGETLNISPLPGTMWYDTVNLLLKIFLVGEANTEGSWVSVTSAHYMTQAIQAGLENMEVKIAALESQLDAITP